MPTVYFATPATDAVELALAAWGSSVSAVLAGAPRVVVVASLPSLTASSFQREARANDVVVYLGHGDAAQLGDATAYMDAASASCCVGRVVFAIACESARTLGPKTVAAGATAYLGFDDLLTFYLPSPSLFGRVVEDALLDFLRRGKTVQEVRDALVHGFQDLVDDYRIGVHSAHPDAALIWLMANTDRRGVALSGSTGATL